MTDMSVTDKAATLPNAGNLDELYVALTRLDMTPGWIDRKTPILWEKTGYAVSTDALAI